MAIDQSAIQRLKNSIQEGELTLRTGKFNRRKLSKLEIEALKNHLKKAKEKLKVISKKPAAKKKATPKKAATSSTGQKAYKYVYSKKKGQLVYSGTIKK
tara:strand:- start:229 stop:525 length:297 start_codon:yes stop_codon:yes gene_type:complete